MMNGLENTFNDLNELKDMNAIAEGFFSLSGMQLITLMEWENPPVAVLANACRQALQAEKSEYSTNLGMSLQH